MMNFKTYLAEKLLFAGCSSIGKNHVDRGSENQDSFAFERKSDEHFMLAVADGVSSCKYSKQGSMVAVETVGNLLDKIMEGSIVIDNTEAIRKFIVTDWKSNFKSDWNDYASTLNFVIVHNNHVLIGQIGDGLILSNIDGNEIVLRDEEEFYSVETFALGESVLKSTFKIIHMKMEQGISIVLTTDGIGNEVDDCSYPELREYLSNLANTNEKQIKREISSWIKVLDKKNGDDKTVGILVLEVEN